MFVMKNITLSADEQLIAAARERARSEQTTLNEQFRRWLADYAQEQPRLRQYEDLMAGLRGQLQAGRRLSRDDRNAR